MISAERKADALTYIATEPSKPRPGIHQALGNVDQCEQALNNAQLINQTSGAEWRQVDGFPRYEVSSEGRIRSLWFSSPRIIRGVLDRDGYAKLVLTSNDGRKQTHKLASIVARAFLGPRPEGAVVAHENGKSDDDRALNLSYKTQRDNIHDKWRHNTMPFGETHHAHKLTSEQVRQIRSSKSSLGECAKKFGVTRCTVSAIRKGRTWKHTN